MVQTSARFDLIKEDVKKILKGAGIAMAGAAATYFLGAVTTLDVGTYTPIVVAVSSIVCNAILKWTSVTKY